MADRENDPNRDHHKGTAKVGDINMTVRDQDDDTDDDDDDLITYHSEDDNQQPSTSDMYIDSPSSKKRKPRSNHDTVQENLADFMNDTDNPERPGSRIVSMIDLCISKTLSENDVLPTNGSLKLNAFEASLLAEEPCFLGRQSRFIYQKKLLAFDEFDRKLNLLLSVHMDNGNHDYRITGDWSGFVNEYNLKSGDEVKFYRIKDDKISIERYCVLRCSKNPKPVKRSKTH